MAGGRTTDSERLSGRPGGGAAYEVRLALSEWEIIRVCDRDLLQREGLGFRAFKRRWQGRLAFSLCSEQSEGTRAFFGIKKGESNASDTYIPNLKAKMDEGMGAGMQNKYWEWWSCVDALYRDWNTPETLWKLNEKDEAVGYFVRLFEKMREIAEPLVDDACPAS